MVWYTAMMPRMKKPPDFEKFTGYRPRGRERMKHCIAAWDRLDRALMNNRRKGR